MLLPENYGILVPSWVVLGFWIVAFAMLILPKLFT